VRKELWFGFSILLLIVGAIAWLMPPPSEMTQGHLGLLMLALIVVAIMLGFPTAFTLMGMGVIFAWLAYRHGDPGQAVGWTLDLMVHRAYAVMYNDVLIAVPLFLFMGYLVERAHLIERLFGSVHVALARVPGSLAVAALATSALFATATGIVGAVVTLMGLLAFPAMLKAGYNVRLAAGVICAGGCLGILIPPSVMLILYGATAGVSVVQLYAGGFFPGLMLAALYILYVVLLALVRPKVAPPLPQSERYVPLSASVRALGEGRNVHEGTRALPALLSGLFRPRVPRAAIAANLFSALLPALFLGTVFWLVYAGLSGSVETYEEGGLEPLGLYAEQIEAAEPEGIPAWFWWTLGIAAAFLVALYAWLNLARAEVLKMLATSFFPLAVLILAVLGSIIFGLATPTEAAAMGGFGGFLLAAAYALGRLPPRRARRLLLTWSPLMAVVLVVFCGEYFLGWLAPDWAVTAAWLSLAALAVLAYWQLRLRATVNEAVYLTAKTSAMVCWLLVGSSIFSAAFALLGGQELIEAWVLSLELTPLQFLILAQIVIFLLGWPLEWTEIIVIFMPIFIPLLPHFDIDPLFFGLLVALNLQTAFLSPPVAMAALYLKGVAPPHVTLGQIFMGVLPFMAIQVIAIALLYLFPQIGLWLPSVLY
jgi:TRAP-type mannitol/chloroaromatic compound transport system permease large subunit